MFRITALTVTLGLVSAAPAARADIITFAGITYASFGPGVTTVEGNFAYDVLPGSGMLFGNTSFGGNPLPHVEGFTNAGGGTLRVVRHDVSGGLFTFQGLDVAEYGLGTTQTIHVFGLRGGVQQGVDDFVTTATNNSWLTKDSLNLSGVAIDELRIRLDAGVGGAGWEEADNVRLTTVTAVPAPPAVVLVGLSACCVAVRRYIGRRMRPRANCCSSS
jgi:hypothetical protein